MELFRDCLLALPALDTLGIVDSRGIATRALRTAFKHKPDFPNITRVAIPVPAHPILSRLPNVEEIVCFSDSVIRKPAKPFLKSLRGPYCKERQGKIEPVLKSLTIVCPTREWKLAEGAHTASFQSFAPYPYIPTGIVKKFPRLRKLCLSEVSSPSHSTLSLADALFSSAHRRRHDAPPWAQRTNRTRDHPLSLGLRTRQLQPRHNQEHGNPNPPSE
jgi:hypothetical protein